MFLPSAQHEKTLAARAAVDLIQSGMRLGLGTGSTAEIALHLLAERVQNQQLTHLQCVATSQRTHQLATSLGLAITNLDALLAAETTPPTQGKLLDLTLDGADELDPALNLIKGGGGALYREKIIASASQRLVIMADASKQKSQLGAFALPVEVNPFGWQRTALCIEELGAKVCLRVQASQQAASMGTPSPQPPAHPTQPNRQPFVSDSHGWILDCTFGQIGDPTGLEKALRSIVGVMETGLFIGLAHQAFVGKGQQTLHLTRPQ